jgi:hypothetical protein
MKSYFAAVTALVLLNSPASAQEKYQIVPWDSSAISGTGVTDYHYVAYRMDVQKGELSQCTVSIRRYSANLNTNLGGACKVIKEATGSIWTKPVTPHIDPRQPLPPQPAPFHLTFWQVNEANGVAKFCFFQTSIFRCLDLKDQ